MSTLFLRTKIKQAKIAKNQPNSERVRYILTDFRVLDIDEEGTCAAAVTEIDFPATEALQLEEPILMNVDRPFVALIVDRETDAIVFAAVIADPVGANAD